MKEQVERPLAKLTPAFWGLGCYKQTAIARDIAIECMEEESTIGVYHKYLDNKYQEVSNNDDAIRAIILGLGLTLIGFLMPHAHVNSGATEQQESSEFSKNFLLVWYCAVFLGDFLLANSAALHKFNATLSKETKEGCIKWLNEKIPNLFKGYDDCKNIDEKRKFCANVNHPKALENNITMGM